MLLAVKIKNGYLIAKDTLIYELDELDNSSVESNDGIFPSCDNFDYVIGGEGEYREVDFVKYLYGALPKKSIPLTASYLYNDFMPYVYNGLLKLHFIEEAKAFNFSTKFMVARKNKAFLINHATVQEIGNEEVVGYGEEVAIASLLLTQGKPGLYRVMHAFDRASKQSDRVGRNIIVADTSKKEVDYTIYYSEDIDEILNGTFVPNQE